MGHWPRFWQRLSGALMCRRDARGGTALLLLGARSGVGRTCALVLCACEAGSTCRLHTCQRLHADIACIVARIYSCAQACTLWGWAGGQCVGVAAASGRAASHVGAWGWRCGHMCVATPTDQARVLPAQGGWAVSVQYIEPCGRIVWQRCPPGSLSVPWQRQSAPLAPVGSLNSPPLAAICSLTVPPWPPFAPAQVPSPSQQPAVAPCSAPLAGASTPARLSLQLHQLQACACLGGHALLLSPALPSVPCMPLRSDSLLPRFHRRGFGGSICQLSPPIFPRAHAPSSRIHSIRHASAMAPVVDAL